MCIFPRFNQLKAGWKVTSRSQSFCFSPPLLSGTWDIVVQNLGAPTVRAPEARARCRIMGSKERRHCFQGFLDCFRALIHFPGNSPAPPPHAFPGRQHQGGPHPGSLLSCTYSMAKHSLGVCTHTQEGGERKGVCSGSAKQMQ